MPPAGSFVKKNEELLESTSCSAALGGDAPCPAAPHPERMLQGPNSPSALANPSSTFCISQYEFCPFLLVHAASHPRLVAPSSPRTCPTVAKRSFHCTICTFITSSALPYASKFHNIYKPTVQEPACPHRPHYPKPPQRSTALRIKPSNLPRTPQRFHQTQTLLPWAGRHPHAALWAGVPYPSR